MTAKKANVERSRADTAEAARKAQRRRALRRWLPYRCPFCLQLMGKAEADEHRCLGMEDR
ncbi:MAG TPA: hypothetical protein VK204_15370 [Nocardioidaceae bacterium]|nr:hypothetical protein [Nocardioidaceae bacterium]